MAIESRRRMSWAVAKDTCKLQSQCCYVSPLWEDFLLESFEESQRRISNWFGSTLTEGVRFLQVIYLAYLPCYTVASGCTSGDSSKLLFKSETIDT